MMGSTEKPMEPLAKLLEQDLPPYLVFTFAATVLVFASVTTEHYFRETWAFLLYSAMGMMLRYAEKDIRSMRKQKAENEIQSVTTKAKGEEKEEERRIGRVKWRIEQQHRYLYHGVNFMLLCLFVGYLIVI